MTERSSDSDWIRSDQIRLDRSDHQTGEIGQTGFRVACPLREIVTRKEMSIQATLPKYRRHRRSVQPASLQPKHGRRTLSSRSSLTLSSGCPLAFNVNWPFPNFHNQSCSATGRNSEVLRESCPGHIALASYRCIICKFTGYGQVCRSECYFSSQPEELDCARGPVRTAIREQRNKRQLILINHINENVLPLFLLHNSGIIQQSAEFSKTGLCLHLEMFNKLPLASPTAAEGCREQPHLSAPDTAL